MSAIADEVDDALRAHRELTLRQPRPVGLDPCSLHPQENLQRGAEHRERRQREIAGAPQAPRPALACGGSLAIVHLAPDGHWLMERISPMYQASPRSRSEM